MNSLAVHDRHAVMARDEGSDPTVVTVTLGLTGPKAAEAAGVLGAVPGVIRVDLGEDDDD